MTDEKLSTDAVEWAYNEYIKNDPERVALHDLVRRRSAVARQVYGIRSKLHMTREELSEFSGLTPETVEDIEESDYDGDWDEAIARIKNGFRTWSTDVILPAVRLKPEDYSVRALSA
ncbi:MAG: hypothetical protein AB1646_10715 [Thermodesulfobacteriota bacterium]